MADEGARITVADLDGDKVAAAVATYGVETCAPDEIYDIDADIFAPYALGAIVNDETIARFRGKVVAGSANNIFAEERHGDELEARGITYAVDYVANSGGTIFDTDRFRKGGFQPDRAWANVRRVYDRILEVFAISDRDGIACESNRNPKDLIPVVRR